MKIAKQPTTGRYDSIYARNHEVQTLLINKIEAQKIIDHFSEIFGFRGIDVDIYNDHSKRLGDIDLFTKHIRLFGRGATVGVLLHELAHIQRARHGNAHRNLTNHYIDTWQQEKNSILDRPDPIMPEPRLESHESEPECKDPLDQDEIDDLLETALDDIEDTADHNDKFSRPIITNFTIKSILQQYEIFNPENMTFIRDMLKENYNIR